MVKIVLLLQKDFLDSQVIQIYFILKNGDTAIDLANGKGHRDVVSILMKVVNKETRDKYFKILEKKGETEKMLNLVENQWVKHWVKKLKKKH